MPSDVIREMFIEDEKDLCTMKLVIVGGVAGGASAAARARRVDEKAEIIMFERGEHVSLRQLRLAVFRRG